MAKTSRTATISEHKMRRMEEAAAQKRHWTRLTGACNNRCIFCLDKDVKKPGIIPTEEVFADLQKGRDLGCERAILSGGEA
ncbi:MAG TPA: radical SAM protein, partial [bacterium]|nr:radical SAM protein [bacterium]